RSIPARPTPCRPPRACSAARCERMAVRIYTVHRRGPDELELIKEGFCWPAFLFAPIWLIWRRQWLGLVVLPALSLALAAVARLTLAEPHQVVLGLTLAFATGVFANDWRRWRLARAGWRLTDTVAAASVREAEEKLAAEGRLAAPVRPAAPAPAPWPRTGAPSPDPFLP